MALQHWKLERDADGIAWATLDVAGSSTNTLGSAVMAELASLLDELDRQPPKGLVIRSGKAAGFIAGADIEEFTRIDSPAAAIEAIADDTPGTTAQAMPAAVNGRVVSIKAPYSAGSPVCRRTTVGC